MVNLGLKVKMPLNTNLKTPDKSSGGVKRISHNKKRKSDTRKTNGKGQIHNMVRNDKDHIRDNEKNVKLMETVLENKSKSKSKSTSIKNKQKILKTKVNLKIKSQTNKNFEDKQFAEQGIIRKINNSGKIHDKVVIDTAAGIHLVHNKDWLHDYTKLIKAPEYWGVGNDTEPINIPGEGILYIKVGNNRSIGVSAFYSPDQEATILSADKLYHETGITLDRGYNSLISEEYKFNTDTFKSGNTVWVDTEKIIDVEKGKRNVIRAIGPQNPLTYKPKISLLEAHLRLNHFPANGIIKSINMNNFDDVQEIKEGRKTMKMWCEICASGRIHRHFHYTGSMNHYSQQKLPGESWSLDIFGPVPHVKERYLLIMIDNVSRFIIATTHTKKNQNEIGDQIDYNIRWVEKQFDTSVKELIMDRGKEFDNQTVESMANNRGINVIYTSTEDHQANGRAERSIRTIIEDTRTLLLQSQLPLSFWTYAAKAAVNVRNCVYNKNVGESPLMNISKHSVRIKLRSFLPFGAPAIIWDHRTKKTEAPGKKAVTLSKDPNGFGYYFYVPKERKVISTTNYLLPDYSIDHGQTGRNQEKDIIGTFLEHMKRKIGDTNDVNFDKNDITNALPMDNEPESDDEDIENEDDRRIMEYLSYNEDREGDKDELSLHPNDIENADLDSLFDDFDEEIYERKDIEAEIDDRDDVEEKIYDREDVEEEIEGKDQLEESVENTENLEELNLGNNEYLESLKDIDNVNDENNNMTDIVKNVTQEDIIEEVINETDVINDTLPSTDDTDTISYNSDNLSDVEEQQNYTIIQNGEQEEASSIMVEELNNEHDIPLYTEEDNRQLIKENSDTSIDNNSTIEKTITIIPKKNDVGSHLKDDIQKSKKQDSLKHKLLEEELNRNNVHTISKADLEKQIDKKEVVHPKKVFKKKKVIRLLYPEQDWENNTVEFFGEKKPTRKIRALFFKQAITNNSNLQEKIKFIEAYNKELNNLVNMKVIDMNISIDKKKVPKDKIVGINTIFNIKRDGTYKARIVCRGDQQSESTYTDIDTAILNLDSLKILLIIANNNRMRLRTLDINHAFLYADLEEEVYITHPKNPKAVTPLRKSLYGLKQSPRRWNITLKEFMNKLGLFDSIYSPGLFVSKDRKIMIAAYVDDCVVAAESDADLDNIIEKLKSRFSLKIVGTMENDKLSTDILGMDLIYDYNMGKVTLSMESYIAKLQDEYPQIINDKMKKEIVPYVNNYIVDPKKTDLILEKNEYKKKVKYLQELIGKLNYIRSRGRIDLEFAVSKVARLVLYPHKKVIEATEKILRYVYNTKNLRTEFFRESFGKCLDITVISDASLASEYDLKSRSGGLIWIGNNFFYGFSKKSSIICTSSAEAELDAINTADKIALLLKLKLEKILDDQIIELRVVTDSKPALDWLSQEYFKARTKFLGLRIERLKERIKDEQCKILKIKGEDNPADALTKPLPRNKFLKLVDIMQHALTPKMLLPLTVQWKHGNSDKK